MKFKNLMWIIPASLMALALSVPVRIILTGYEPSKLVCDASVILAFAALVLSVLAAAINSEIAAHRNRAGAD